MRRKKNQSCQTQKGSREGVEELNVLEKMDGGLFSAIVMVCSGAETLNCEMRSDRCSASLAAGVSWGARSQLFSWFV